MAIGVALYGVNGHQVPGQVDRNADARLVAIAGLPPERLTERQRADPALRRCATLDELLAVPGVELVSLCSPRRCDQAHDAIRCLEAGKHVYAEKPAALTEADLDAIVATAARCGRQFHEMAGTAFGQPWLAMRNLVASGRLGTVVEVVTQKSYPMHAGRPQDEDVDGGLILQCGVHALRFVEHVAGQPVTAVEAYETTLGNPVAGGGLRVAAALMLRLANGGVGTVAANYLNPKGFKHWGNEMVRIFGTAGFVEAVDGGSRTRLVLGDQDLGPLDTSAPGRDYFDLFVDTLLGRGAMPLSLADELHPTRVVIRARASARQHGHQPC